jgi:carbon starvation protein CstA
MKTFPFLSGSVRVYAPAYCHHSAFLAAQAMTPDDRRITPIAYTHEDEHNSVLSPKWFGLENRYEQIH